MRWDLIQRNILLISLAFLLLGANVNAQVGTTSVRGTVLDKTGAAIVGATVTLENTAQALHQEMKTSATGAYEFLALPPGTYSLSVEMAGFRKWQQKSLPLLVNTPTTLNLTLEVGTATETVEVSAQAVTLNTTDASLGIAFNENQVKQLPLESRNVPDLLSLQAGVVYTGNRSDIDTNTDTRSGSVNGARSDQSNITLDGIPVNPKGGYAFQSVLPVTLDSVEEFRVTTTNYNADQGSSSGAQVALVTKSGTNNFHGSLYEYNRTSATSANDYFLKQSQLNLGTPNQPLKLTRNIFGASVGGPIKKDRLFFFANYEGYRDAEAQSALRTIPTATLRDGIMQYACADTSACPGGSVMGASGGSYSVAPGNFALSPTQLADMDPQGLGPSSAVLSFMQSTYPLPNDTTVGDGVNTSGYRFAAPTYTTHNWYIAKLDYNITADARHRLSVSGALANENSQGAPFLPGSIPETVSVNYNKGIIANYSATLTPTLINNFRYGFIRESNGFVGDSTQSWNYFRSIDMGVTRSSSFQRPIHNLYDDVTKIHGKHTFQFGVQAAFLRNPETNLNNSFSDGVTNASWLDTAALANTGATGHFDPYCSQTAATVTGNCYNPDPTSPDYNPNEPHYPQVDPNFGNSYDFPLTAMTGMVSEVDAYYNFDRQSNVLAQGTPISRRFAENGFELYAQDIWKVKPNLTLTFGLRYSLFSPPWETNGLEATTTEPLGDWFNQRGKNMAQGIGSYADPAVTFDWAGPANGGKSGYYNWDYHDFGPRVALAWSPQADGGFWKSVFGGPGKSSVRAGFGIVYDRLGESIVDTFDQSGGSFGLLDVLTNTAGEVDPSVAPRITDMHVIPTTDTAGDSLFAPVPPALPSPFPNIFAGDNLSPYGFAIAWGNDSHLKTPYSETIDLSFSRELPSGFSIEAAYVGRLSHRLLAQEDMAMPLNLTDPKTKITYFQAVDALATLYRQGVPTSSVTPQTVGPTAQYWADIMPALQPGGVYGLFCGGGGTTSPLQAAYDLFSCFPQNETTALFIYDLFGLGGCNAADSATCGSDYNVQNNYYYPTNNPGSYWNGQYSSLYAWRTIGNSAYNAMELTLRHRMLHGLQFDLNYTFSKSMDINSDAERIGEWGGLGGQIINSWNPNEERAVSDFDATHQLNANWIYELPFGKGRAFASDAHGFAEAVIGGWQLSGLFRLTSGFPVNISNGYQWPTNWQLSGNAQLISPVKTGAYPVTSGPDAGNISIFSTGPDAINNFQVPFPGSGGARNQLRGQGFFNIDLGLAKRWHMPWNDGQSLQFRWEVFNVTNSVRFNVQSAAPELDISSTFGNYTGLLTNPRVMQFALRYEF
ncbi:MAG TPA: carboxypeptidase-like regulatory domain-containing protein [Candidatus Solibacter sp.]|nr:carboxypeptidase-like regulatory domain-containing protein [Candidatus Solibacter sp.]